jgi:hypothetical protein
MMAHVALVGDSIFDNAAYVPGEPALAKQLDERLPKGWQVTLLAKDGAIALDVAAQVKKLPADITHLMVSAGGNDALENIGILEETTLTVAQGFERLAAAQNRFRHEYSAMLDALTALGRPVGVCTVYDSVPGLPLEAAAGLAVFNDVILSQAFARGLPVLDLRRVCTDGRDYSELSPIEPSAIGGAKIALALSYLLGSHDFSRTESVVYGPA